MNGTREDRYRGCLLGLAAGDAVGTTLEFKRRGSFTPLTDMVGGGPFGLRAGEWTDDTSMALCLGTSLIERGGFDPRDQMSRYLNWYLHGYLSSTGSCFDIGNTVRDALHAYQRSGDPFSGSSDPRSAGNGSLMRLGPVVMYFASEPERALHYARESSRTTHAASECLEACSLFARILLRALAGEAKPDVLRPLEGGCASRRLGRIADASYLEQGAQALRGSGYVVDTLESALWCFAHASTFEEAILAAANLGEDADTTAAVCGQLAGAHHGESGIPPRWLERLAFAAEIRALAEQLMASPVAKSEEVER